MLYFIKTDLSEVLQEYLLKYILLSTILTILLVLYRTRVKRRQINIKEGLLYFFFLLYLLFMYKLTLGNREIHNYGRMNLKLFGTFGSSKRIQAYLIENILLFIPYGFFLPMLFSKCSKFLVCLMLSALTSLTIETLQLLTGLGVFTVDDMMLNIIGGLLGWVAFRCLKKGVTYEKKSMD